MFVKRGRKLWRKCGNRKRMDEFNEERSLISLGAEVPNRKTNFSSVTSVLPRRREKYQKQ